MIYDKQKSTRSGAFLFRLFMKAFAIICQLLWIEVAVHR